MGPNWEDVVRSTVLIRERAGVIAGQCDAGYVLLDNGCIVGT